MKEADGGKTNATLLERVRNWRDHPAWVEFFHRYDPVLRSWSRRSGFDDDASKELCQRIWIELADRVQRFHYDPSRRFRGWLREFWRCRALDFIEERNREGRRLRLCGESLFDEDDVEGVCVPPNRRKGATIKRIPSA